MPYTLMVNMSARRHDSTPVLAIWSHLLLDPPLLDPPVSSSSPTGPQSFTRSQISTPANQQPQLCIDTLRHKFALELVYRMRAEHNNCLVIWMPVMSKESLE